jgi:hypothetical protein
MILPLSKSFQSLKSRLECVNIVSSKSFEKSETFFGIIGPGKTSETKETSNINVEECLKLFDDKQQKIKMFAKEKEQLKSDENSGYP